MRYPLSVADWPTAFNKFSKYLGRHWPTGPLALNDARERAARLLGYHSVHDAKQELVAPDAMTSCQHWGMHDHMWLKAWVLYRAPMAPMQMLLKRLPWGELAAHKAYLVEQRNRPFLIMDEFSTYSGDSKTNKRMIQLIEDQIIPPYEYALNHQGEIYQAEHAESVLELAESVEDLAEVGFEGDLEGFVQEHVMPLFWRPLDDLLKHVTMKDTSGLTLGTRCLFQAANDDKACLVRYFGFGFSVFYPVVVRTDEQAREVLAKILRREPFYALESPEDNHLFYNETGVDGASGEWFVVEGQHFYSPEGDNKQTWKELGEALPNITSYVSQVPMEGSKYFLSPESIRVYRALDLWHQDRSIDETYLGMETQDRQALLSQALGHERLTGEDFIKMGGLIPEDEPVTIAECLGHRDVIREERSILRDMGRSVSRHHPELTGFYDDEALGYLLRAYDDMGHQTWLIEPDVQFIGFVVFRALSARYRSMSPIDCHSLPSVCKLALQWLMQDCPDVDEDFFYIEWRKWVGLLNRYNKQLWLFRNALKERPGLGDINQDERFVSNGPKQEIVLESMVEMLCRLAKAYNF